MQGNRCVLNFNKKAINALADRTHFGRLFHIHWPVTAKLLCPIVFFDIVTLKSVMSHADRKARVGA